MELNSKGLTHFFWRFYLNKNRKFLDTPTYFLTDL